MKKRLHVTSIPPWEPVGEITIATELVEACSKKDPVEKLHEITQKTMQKLEIEKADVVIWTDGSVGENQSNGGSGAIVERRGPEGMIKTALKEPAGKYCSSFVAETNAIRMATDLLAQSDQRYERIIILTDSKSSLQQISNGSNRQKDKTGDRIWKNVKTIQEEKGNPRIHMQWIPSHVGTQGNEDADELAKEATEMRQDQVPIGLDTAKRCIHRKVKEKWKQGCKHEVYDKWKKSRKVDQEKKMTRKQRTTLAQLRTGHSYPLRAYRHRLGKEDSATCEECGTGDETTDHLLLECDRWRTARIRYYDDPSPKPEDLTSNKILDFLRGIGRMTD